MLILLSDLCWFIFWEFAPIWLYSPGRWAALGSGLLPKLLLLLLLLPHPPPRAAPDLNLRISPPEATSNKHSQLVSVFWWWEVFARRWHWPRILTKRWALQSFEQIKPNRTFLRAPVLVLRGITGSRHWRAAWLSPKPKTVRGPATSAWRNRLQRKLGGNLCLSLSSHPVYLVQVLLWWALSKRWGGDELPERLLLLQLLLLLQHMQRKPGGGETVF